MSSPVWVSALAATLFVQTVSSFSSLAIPLLGPPLMARAGLAPESIGLVSALTSAGICWSLACGGPMLAHHGPVRTLQIGLACMALGLFLLSQPLGLLGLLGALAVGFGLGPNTPAGSQILIRHAPPQHRTLIFSIKQAGVPLGGALAGLLVAPLVLAQGLTVTLGLVIAVTLVTILLVQPFRRRLDRDHAPPDDNRGRVGWARALLSPAALASSVRTLRAHPSLPVLTALGASFSVMQACLTAFTATYVVTRHGASLAEAGRIVAVMQGASMLGRIVMGWVADRRGRAMRMLALQAVASALAVALLVLAGDRGPWALYLCAGLAGFIAIGWNGVHIAELARVAPLQLVSDVTSAASLFGFVGSICGPLLFALLVAWSGSYGLAFLVMAAQLALCGLACLVLAPRAGKDGAAR
ncbi:MFS transporter [Pseudoroseomonas cervicalis]|uniref:MFS transporter n=1 Tax=Teichococcus cervicalis TaxID=204525 RepID=UPI002783D157|nr:MFS transporter [Pseudoroseomonas cervicalis]MDQ1081508.1 MFS family permease [Pseudoroseomonas cervicalis]